MTSAKQLGLNPKTVSNHQSSIKQKLGAETPAQLWRAAMQLGLVPPLSPHRAWIAEGNASVGFLHPAD